MMRTLLACLSVCAGCTPFSDPCIDVPCGDGEICVALATGPRCVCDADHDDSVDGGCFHDEEGE